MVIYGDISEKKKVHKRFKERLGKHYKIKELGTFDCKLNKIPLRKNFGKGETKTYCAIEDEIPFLEEHGFEFGKGACKNCENGKFKRFADFEIAPHRAFYERKLVTDFVASMSGRLYNQMNKMDEFIIDGHKGVILEGLAEENGEKENGFFQGLKKERKRLREMSPLQQAIEISGGRKEWVLSFIRECKMRGIEFVQTFNLDETIDFLIECDKGFGNEPKFRVIPKKYPKVSLDQNILILFPDVGKVRSDKLLKEHKTLANFIKQLRKIPLSEIKKQKNKSIKKYYEIFIRGGKL